MNVRGFFQKTFPIIRDVAIFTAAIAAGLFNYLSDSIRQDIRANATGISTLEEKYKGLTTTFKTITDKQETNNKEIQQSISNLNDNFNTKFTTLSSQVSRIEGKLGY